MKPYYTYVHRAGYGRDDHMAAELISRAARQLGLDTGDSIAQHVGLASHPVPLSSGEVRLASGPGVRAKMTRAMRVARAELVRRPDCVIEVQCHRLVEELLDEHQYRDDAGRPREWRRYRVTLERPSGRDWIAVDSVEREVTL